MRRKIKQIHTTKVSLKADLVRKAYKPSLAVTAAFLPVLLMRQLFSGKPMRACDLPKCANTAKIYSFISADDKRRNQSMLYEVVVIFPTQNQGESKTPNSLETNQFRKCQKHLTSN